MIIKAARNVCIPFYFCTPAWAVFLALGVCSAQAEYADRVREDAPVAWWRFEGDTKDHSGNARHGLALGSLSYTNGVAGQAAQFNGEDSVVEIAARAGLDQDTLSVECWFRSTQPWRDRFWPGSATLISTATPGPGSGDWLINAASQDQLDEGRLLAETGPQGKPNDLYLASRADDPLNDGHWHHVVLTRQVEGAARLYVDGVLHAEGHDGGGPIGNTRAIDIGGERVHPGGRYFRGELDEVAMYATVLSPERVAAHYNAVAPGLPPRPAKRVIARNPAKPKHPPVALSLVAPEPVVPVKARILEKAQRHWAFQPIRNPRIPAVKNVAWVQHPIDAFILARLETEGRAPAAEADRATLIRRAHVDLLGLPPNPDEKLPEAWSELVAHLLASPHYGERYARHWLDVARYADSAGYELDNFYYHAAHYRDYVIRALNEDTPFDQFIREQLAADVLFPEDERLRYATGFLTVGPHAEEGGIKRPRRVEYQRLTDAADTTAEALLGLSYGCARCHDHKYEPITQRDYFALQAIFAASELVQLPVEETKNKDAEAKRQGARMHVIANRRVVPQTRLFARGDYESPAGAVPPGLPVLFPGGGDFDEASSDDAQRRRVRLAEWMVDPENPLTARVIVNRVWMWHFGWPLVPTPNDFGLQGESPTHPELLDYLAYTFRENNWSLKTLHTQIMTSATYRLEAGEGFPPRRLEAEAIWDHLLATAGVLNETMYGPPVFPPIDPVMVQAKKNATWTTPKDRADWARRGLYVVAHRSLNYPFFETFNVTLPVTSCGRRDQTVVSPQALTLLNDPLVNDLARAFAERLIREGNGEPEAMMARGWALAFGRTMRAEERQLTRQYFGAQEAWTKPDAKLISWCLGLFNANEFIYVD